MKENYATYFADWLEGKITDKEVKALIPEKEFLAFQKINKTFDVISDLESPLDTTLFNIKKHINKKTPSKIKVINMYTKWVVSVAAMLVLFIGINTYFTNLEVVVYADYGSQKTIALLDNSEVIINANSTIKYNKSTWKNKRELFLDGEAYFKVTKGNTFTVNTKNGSVTVLGTQFNVNSKDHYFNVICYEGKVKVVAQEKEHILTPGKGVEVIDNQERNLLILNHSPNWFKGESEFDNVPLKMVIDELENQFHITFDRTKINQTKNFTGSFNNKKLNTALASVFKPMQINYKITKDKVILFE
jgi:ferric-dicitrate binding protein FerR (iron transport regulator)